MALKKTLKTLDGLDESIAKLYTKAEDGTFRLDVEGEDDASALKGALSKERDNASKASREAAELKKRLAAIEEERAAKEEELLKKSGDVGALERSYKEKQASLEAKLKAELAERDKEIDNFYRGNAIERALDGKVLPKAKDWMKRDVLERTRLELIDGRRVVRVLDDSGNPTATQLDDYIKTNFIDNNEYAPFIVGSRASGGGSNGANAGGGSGAGNGRVITTEAFSKLPFPERRAFIKDGGHIKDQ